MDLGLQGRVALVSAASSGLGLGVATALAAEGAAVSICARTPATLAAAHATVDAAGPGKVLSEVVDVTDHDAAAGWVRHSAEQLGGVDVLVANTPGVTHGWAEDFAVADYRAALDSSLLPHVAMVLEAAPWLRREGFGRVVLVTSEAVREPAPHNVLSGVARVGVLAFARNLVHSFGSSGVTVNVLAPGYHATPALKGPGGVTDLDELATQVPLGRVGDAADFGALAAFLASRQAAFVTGALLLADGGHTAGLV